MSPKRRAQLVANVFEVVCPYCGNAQPNLDDGSFLHDVEQLAKRPSRSTCVDCNAEFVFDRFPTTARVDRSPVVEEIERAQQEQRRHNAEERLRRSFGTLPHNPKRKPRPAPTTKTVDADGVKIYVERKSSRCWVAWVDEDDARAVGLERLVGTEYEGPTQREAVASAVSEVLANRTDAATGFRRGGIKT